MTRIKICGLTRADDVEVALEIGADAIGLNFVAGTPRALDPLRASALARQAAGRTLRVGVFRDAPLQDLLHCLAEVPLDAVQLHGAEPPEYAARVPLPVIKALPGDDGVAARARGFPGADLLVDHPSGGGSGRGWDFSLACALISERRVWLAGGLSPQTVGACVTRLRPYGVDASSGLEASPGVKDPEKVRAFARAVRAADRDAAAGVPRRAADPA